VWFTPWFKPLVGHTTATVTSQVPISDHLWKGRLLVTHGLRAEEQAFYEVIMIRVRTRQQQYT
jgi:hypothetical protein